MSVLAYPVQAQNFSLSGAGSSIGDTVLNLKSFKDILGVNLTMTQFGSIGYGTIEAGNGVQEEQISFSGVTQNSDGTAQLTGVKHVLFIPPYTETDGMTITHPGSVVFIISNTAAWENSIYTYANTIASGGAPASSTVIGITKLSVDPAVAGTPIAVGTNDNRVSPVSLATITDDKVAALAGTGTPSVSNKYVTANTLLTKADVKFGGTGADGALTITSGATNIDCANAAVVVKDYTSISITGTASLTFTNPHANGTIIILKSQGAVTITSSTVPAINAKGMGASDTTKGQTSFIIPTNNGTSPGNANGTGGAAIGYFTITKSTKSLPLTCGAGGGAAVVNGGSNATYAGGGGASAVTAGTNGSGSQLASFGGSGGGSGGGCLFIECAGSYNVSSTLSVAGNNGTASPGGAGGGGGGSMFILYNTLTSNTGTYTVSGGTGASAGGLTGGNGGAGYSLVALNTEFA